MDSCTVTLFLNTTHCCKLDPIGHNLGRLVCSCRKWSRDTYVYLGLFSYYWVQQVSWSLLSHNWKPCFERILSLNVPHTGLLSCKVGLPSNYLWVAEIINRCYATLEPKRLREEHISIRSLFEFAFSSSQCWWCSYYAWLFWKLAWTSGSSWTYITRLFTMRSFFYFWPFNKLFPYLCCAVQRLTLRLGAVFSDFCFWSGNEISGKFRENYFFLVPWLTDGLTGREDFQ